MIIELDSVTKVYTSGVFKKKVKAVSDLSLTVGESEVFGLVGPNGAGKSTTIRLMLGLSRPTAGVIKIKGQPLNRPDRLKEIGYLPENPYLYDHLTLAEVLWFSGVSSGMRKQDALARSELLLERFGLTSAVKRPLRTFSKGMMQRAGLCFALVHDPSIIILDEPMSGLDPIGRKMVFDLVQELKTEGKTIFFCSHILNDVERLCDRIGILHQGRLVESFEVNQSAEQEIEAIRVGITPVGRDTEKELLPLVVRIDKTAQGWMLTVKENTFLSVMQCLERHGIKVTLLNSTKSNLEDIFMAKVGSASDV